MAHLLYCQEIARADGGSFFGCRMVLGLAAFAYRFPRSIDHQQRHGELYGEFAKQLESYNADVLKVDGCFIYQQRNRCRGEKEVSVKFYHLQGKTNLVSVHSFKSCKILFYHSLQEIKILPKDTEYCYDLCNRILFDDNYCNSRTGATTSMNDPRCSSGCRW